MEQQAPKSLNADIITKLIEMNQKEPDDLELIWSCLDSFEQYHRAVFDDLMFTKVYGSGAVSGDDYRKQKSEADATRTFKHNNVIVSVNVLNRMAANAGLEPVYDGIVAKERPYRREVANAVFAYLESIIHNRP